MNQKFVQTVYNFLGKSIYKHSTVIYNFHKFIFYFTFNLVARFVIVTIYYLFNYFYQFEKLYLSKTVILENTPTVQIKD